MYEAKRFQFYDYESPTENKRVYGTEDVPEINLQSFSQVPIGLFCGKTDGVVSPGDYEWLRDELKAKDNCVFF